MKGPEEQEDPEDVEQHAPRPRDENDHEERAYIAENSDRFRFPDRSGWIGPDE